LAFHKDNPRSIVACIDRARTAARQVRERISSEMWESLNSLHLFLSNPALPEVAERNPHAFFQRVRNDAQLIQGLADATLAHDECWYFVRLGTFLERADNVWEFHSSWTRAKETIPERPSTYYRGRIFGFHQSLAILQGLGQQLLIVHRGGIDRRTRPSRELEQIAGPAQRILQRLIGLVQARRLALC
jgi:hypothetical protein